MKINSRSYAGYSIRQAEPHHIPLLNDIELAAVTLFPVGSLPEHILFERLPLNVLQAAKDKDMLWVAVDANDVLVGYLLLQVVNGFALLAQVDVHPNHGRQGLGTALIVRGIKQIQEMGFTDLYLTTFSHVKWNAPFYEKLGFNILKNRELPDVISNILHAEQSRGLTNRVAMKLSISS
jgi:N-acetylglutamate synthase-like GNAT family acetyltransferase